MGFPAKVGRAFASHFAGRFLAGWRGLGRFWLLLLSVGAISAGLLEALGPPASGVAPRPVANRSLPAEHGAPEGKAAAEGKVATDGKVTAEGKSNLVSQVMRPLVPPAVVGRPGRDTPGPIADPDPSLLEPSAADPGAKLPRTAADGRVPMAVYAAGFDVSSRRPRVGLLIAGIGMSEADSLAAIKDLPPAVTLAFSPYAANAQRLAGVARTTEHEYLLSIPMEPQGYPLNDPDDRHALMASLPLADNLNRLRWLLSRLTGYVGVTNAFGALSGERLAGVPDQLSPLLEEVGHRGLLFVDARPGQAVLPAAWNRSISLVIDADPVDAALLDQRLDMLTQQAADNGSALGLVQVPRPVTLARVAAWTNRVASKGLALAPVSALVLPPLKQEGEK